MLLGLVQVVAQFQTPGAFQTPEPSPSHALSERALLTDRIDRIVAQTKARTGGRLGVVVWDLGTNVLVQRNAEAPFPMAGLLHLPIAFAAYQAIDFGKLKSDAETLVLPSDLSGPVSPIADAYAGGPHTYATSDLIERMLLDGDATAADVLYRILGGADGINAALRVGGADAVVVRTDDAGLVDDAKHGRTFLRGGDNAASPAAIALLLAQLARDQVLSRDSRRALLELLARVDDDPGRLRAGLPGRIWLAHLTGTSPAFSGIVDATNDAGIANVNGRHVVIVAMLQGARGTAAMRDAAIADVARAAVDATRLFPL